MPTTTPPAVTAVAAASNDRTHFLSGPSFFGNPSSRPIMGTNKIETGVMVFDDGSTINPVGLSLEKGGFNLHLFLSTHEARTLARALAMAAAHADSAKLDADTTHADTTHAKQARAALDADITAAAQAAGVVVL